ncbi:MAG TPA: WYL domain-containing protein [Ktedonobacterales bacterium]|nr:WYL domain-containing protein [Ktedonobacterales bacterium]
MRADRLLSLMLLLQARGRMTAQDLAARLEVSERTVYRDISALGMAGIPVYAERGPGGGCGLMDGFRTSLNGLSEAEVETLLLSSVPGPLRDLGLAPALEAALLKLLAALPSTRRGEAERFRRRIHVDPAGWGRSGEAVPHLRTLQEAVWQDRRLRLTYAHDHEVSERTVEPMGLVAKASIWYLVAQTEGETRVFRVSRVVAAEPLEATFARTEEFDLAAYWTESCARFEASWAQYPVTLRVGPDMLPYLPMILGDSVRPALEHAEPPDAAGWVAVTVMFESLEVARSRVLGLGTQVEALAPVELRESLAMWAADVARFYGR